MCLRVVERYAVCNCIYFVHGIDQCQLYGQIGHNVQERVVLVGHSCTSHLASAYPSYYSSGSTGYSQAPAAVTTTSSASSEYSGSTGSYSTGSSATNYSASASTTFPAPSTAYKTYDFHNYYYSSQGSR